MNHRLQPIVMVFLLLASTNVLGSTPNLYMLSLFISQSVTSSTTHGGRITQRFDKEELSGAASFRFQQPETNITAHMAKQVHGEDSLLSGFLLGNLAYFSHAQDNGATSLTAAYTLRPSTPFKDWPTIFKEISCSICWTDASNRKQAMQELGV